MEAITRYCCVVVVADAAAFWRALVVTPAPALWHHASPYDINATSNATYDINCSLVLCASRRFLSFLRLSLATLPPSSKLLTSSVSNPKYPCKPVFPSSRGPHSPVRYRSPSRRWCGTSALGLSLRRPKEQLEGQAVVSCRCTVQLRGTGTGSTGCECECVWSLQYLIHHVGERDIPLSRPFGRHPGHVRTGIAPKPNR